MTSADAMSAEPRATSDLGVSAASSWLMVRLHSRAFWAVQGAVLVITALHYYLEATGKIPTFERTVVILYIIPIVIASLRFSREGGIATSVLSVVLTVPAMLDWHRHNLNWVEDVIPTSVICLVGIVLTWRVQTELRLRLLTQSAEAGLQKLASQYRVLFESASDAVLVFDRCGRVQLANPAAAAAFDQDLEQIERSTLARLIGRDAADRLLRGFETDKLVAAAEEIQPRLQFTIETGKRSEKTLDVALAVIEDQSGSVVVQAVLRDVTAEYDREASLRLYAAEITKAQERERQRIARELHDDAVQSLVALCQGLEHLQVDERAGARGPSPEELRELAKSTLDNLRRFARDLRPTLLDDLGLVAALRWCVSETSKRLDLDTRMEIAGVPRRLSGDAELTLFRVVQEALHNVERHAQATQVVVELGFLDDAVRIQVTDDGKGFAVPAALRSLAHEGHLGLLGMQERVQLLGGSLRVQSHVGEGTQIEVSVPDLAQNQPASLVSA